MAKCNPKVHVGRCLERIDEFLSSYVKGTCSQAWKDKFIAWLTPELLTLAKKHGLPIQLSTGGEGVTDGQPHGNGNQSLPQSKNPQWPLPADGQVLANGGASDVAEAGLPEIPAGGVIKLDDGGKQAPLPRSRFASAEVVAKADPKLPCYDPRPVGELPTMTVVVPEVKVETVTVTETGVSMVGQRVDGEQQKQVMVAPVIVPQPCWPIEAKLHVEGYALNNRLMVARLYDEEGGQKYRRVSLWRDRAGRVKPGRSLMCRLDKPGNPPVYLAV